MGFIRPGKRLQKTMEHHHDEGENPLFQLAIFNSFLYVYQRVPQSLGYFSHLDHWIGFGDGWWVFSYSFPWLGWLMGSSLSRYYAPYWASDQKWVSSKFGLALH